MVKENETERQDELTFFISNALHYIKSNIIFQILGIHLSIA